VNQAASWHRVGIVPLMAVNLYRTGQREGWYLVTLGASANDDAMANTEAKKDRHAAISCPYRLIPNSGYNRAIKIKNRCGLVHAGPTYPDLINPLGNS